MVSAHDRRHSRARAGVALLLLGLAACAQPARLAPAPAGARGTLRVEVTGLRSDAGRVIASVFSGPSGFPDDVNRALITLATPIRDGRASAVFADLPWGGYAVAVLHDEDGDGEMARTWLGAPLEGHGASNDPEPRFGPPDFAEARFGLAAPTRTVAVRVSYRGGMARERQRRRAGGEPAR